MMEGTLRANLAKHANNKDSNVAFTKTARVERGSSRACSTRGYVHECRRPQPHG